MGDGWRRLQAGSDGLCIIAFHDVPLVCVCFTPTILPRTNVATISWVSQQLDNGWIHRQYTAAKDVIHQEVLLHRPIWKYHVHNKCIHVQYITQAYRLHILLQFPYSCQMNSTCYSLFRDRKFLPSSPSYMSPSQLCNIKKINNP